MTLPSIYLLSPGDVMDEAYALSSQINGEEKKMEETSLSKKLADYLLENFNVEFNSRGNLRIDDFSISGSGLAKRFTKYFFTDKKKVKELEEDLLLLSDKELIEEIGNALTTTNELIRKHLQNLEMEEIKESSELSANREAYLNVIPVIDMENVKGSAVMVEKDSGRVSELQEKAWERVVGSKYVSKIMEIGYCGRFVYNPRIISPYHKTETPLGEEVIYNKYIPPTYRIKRDLSVKLDPIFIKFLEGLFEDSCRDYAYNWIYHSCFTRIPVYLVLVGAGGIGKNLLAEMLKMIHGHTNFTKAPPSALDSKFNGHLLDATMIYYDECKFSAGKEGATIRKNRLKEWANDSVPVELKGIDASNKDIFCSAIIATNNDSDVHLERLDRKFSVMELSEERLEKRMGLKDTQFLWEYIHRKDLAHAVLNYLEDFIDPDFNPNIEYKGPKFDQLVLSSLYGWQQELLDRIENAESKYISLKECRENISLFPHHNNKVDDFLKNFTIDGNILGRVVKIEGIKKIKIDDSHLPKDLEESSLDNLD